MGLFSRAPIEVDPDLEARLILPPGPPEAPKWHRTDAIKAGNKYWSSLPERDRQRVTAVFWSMHNGILTVDDTTLTIQSGPWSGPLALASIRGASVGGYREQVAVDLDTRSKGKIFVTVDSYAEAIRLADLLTE